MRLPVLETVRLQIRPLTLDDLDTIHQLLDIELRHVDFGDAGAQTREARQQWLQWTIMSYEHLATLYQPPYGDRAVVLKHSGVLIGVCGFVPCLDAFGQLPSFATACPAHASGLTSPEFGLYYAFFPAHQRQGYATEAIRAMIDFAFGVLRLRRLVAMTTADNTASIGVMRRVGMRIEHNPYTDPLWFQVVGILEHPTTMAASAGP